jgi:GT2 family glycosyltransferase
MEMRRLRIAVVTPIHNRKDLTLDCLRSFFKADLADFDVRFIIVDDGSTDGTSDSVNAEFPDVEIIKGDGNLWYTAGTNLGLKAALEQDVDYILSINNDSVFDPQFLKFMTSTAEAYPRSIVGPVLLNWDEPEKIFQLAPKWNVWWGGMRHWNKQTIHMLPKRPWRVELIVGNCVLFPAEVVRELGLMDEKRLPQYGDAEYTPRMRRAGWPLLIDPRARVFCKPNDVLDRFSNLPLKSMVSNLIINRYHPHSLRRRLHMNLGSAPNRVEGFFAFVIFFIRVLFGRNIEGRWAAELDEKPLSEIYSNDMVETSREKNSAAWFDR